MIRFSSHILLALLCACGSEAEVLEVESESPVETAEPVNETVPTEEPAQPSTTEPSQPGTEVVAPTSAPLADNGLPAFSQGRPIRLETMETVEREVDGRTLPSVVLSNPTTTTALDAQIERRSMHTNRCRIKLAQESFVSMLCVAYEENPVPRTDHVVSHFHINPAGEVEPIDIWEQFHPGTRAWEMARLFMRDPGSTNRRAVVGPAGLELTSPWEEDSELVRIPWRAVAPYVRVDSPLGSLLTAAGLSLAPAGTPMPENFLIGPMLPGDYQGELLQHWLGLPEEHRNSARLVAPAGGDHLFGLAFAPGPAPTGVTETGYYVEPAAQLLFATATESVVIRENPGRRGPILRELPIGTILVAARGFVGTRDSGLDSRSWALVGSGPRETGWTSGRSIEPRTGCVPVLPHSSSASRRPFFRGTATWHKGESTQELAWFLVESPGVSTIMFRALSDCSVGEVVRSVSGAGTIREVYFTRAGDNAGDSLLAVVSESHESALSVYGPDGDEPVLRQTVTERSVLATSVTRGQEYSPLEIREGRTTTSYAWDGTSLTPQAP